MAHVLPQRRDREHGNDLAPRVEIVIMLTISLAPGVPVNVIGFDDGPFERSHRGDVPADHAI
jgi:hypothetical protein